MKENFSKDISASTLQVIINQILGLLVFVLISRYLDKSDYGELNWSLAIITFVITILSLRLEQIVVRKVAAGEDSSLMLTLFVGHTLIWGLGFYLVLFVASLLFPLFFHLHQILLILTISQLLTFVSLPFKQIANGKESFKLLAIMSTVSNLLRAVCLLWVIFFAALSVQKVIGIYIFSAFSELVVSYFVVRYRLRVSISKWTFKNYFSLLRESLPQIGSVILNASISRIDWILLGIFSSTVITAEYSFAYKVFELCPVPLLILSPILLSRFSKYFSTNSENNLLDKKREISFFIRFEMIAATSIPLVLNVLWSPMIDFVTNNKYGAVNKTNFLLLSLCLPFQYMINFLWTVEFAQNRLSRIFRITAVTCLIIVVGDLFMIPLYNAQGAALVYLLATMVEYVIYLNVSIVKNLKDSWQSLILCMVSMLISIFLVKLLTDSVVLQVVLSFMVYCLLLLTTKQIKKDDLVLIKEWLLHKPS